MKYLLNIAIIVFAVTSLAQAKPRCAILPFKAGPGFTEKQAQEANTHFRTALVASGKYEVLPEKETQDTIHSHLAEKPASVTPYYVIAGRILRADYVVTGTTEKESGSLWLKTELCDVQNEKIQRRIKVYYKGDIGTFLKMAPQSNVKQLLAYKSPQKTPPPIAEAPKPQKTPSKRWGDWDYSETFSTVHGYTHDRVQLGARISYYKLMETEKESFLGSINNLKEDQDFAPRLFARVKIMEPFWVTLGYKKLRATTWTLAEPEEDLEGYTDGTIELTGPYVLLHFHSKRQNDLQWYSEIGFALYEANFIHDPAWRDARGDIDSHLMYFEDTLGIIVNGGCDLMISDDISISAHVGYNRVSSDMTYYLYGQRRDSRTFPLTNLSLGIGAQYHF